MLASAAVLLGAVMATAAGFRMDTALGVYTMGWLLVFGGLAYGGARLPVPSRTAPDAKP